MMIKKKTIGFILCFMICMSYVSAFAANADDSETSVLSTKEKNHLEAELKSRITARYSGMFDLEFLDFSYEKAGGNDTVKSLNIGVRFNMTPIIRPEDHQFLKGIKACLDEHPSPELKKYYEEKYNEIEENYGVADLTGMYLRVTYDDDITKSFKLYDLFKISEEEEYLSEFEYTPELNDDEQFRIGYDSCKE